MTDALTSHLPLDHCPRCREKLDAATSMEFETPQPGDLSVCIRCAAVLQWDQDMRLQMADLNSLPIEALEKLLKVVSAVRYVKPRMRHWSN